MIEKVTLRLSGNSSLLPTSGIACEDTNPKALMLYAGAKCAGLTALMIMQKQRVDLKGFEITLSGKLSTDTLQAESVFLSFHMAYNVQCGDEGDKAKVIRAIELAHEKHCGLMHMYAKIAPVTHEIDVVSSK